MENLWRLVPWWLFKSPLAHRKRLCSTLRIRLRTESGLAIIACNRTLMRLVVIKFPVEIGHYGQGIQCGWPMKTRRMRILGPAHKKWPSGSIDVHVFFSPSLSLQLTLSIGPLSGCNLLKDGFLLFVYFSLFDCYWYYCNLSCFVES